MDGREYDDLVRDVAARIIQTYWRRHTPHGHVLNRVGSCDRVLAPRMNPPLRPQQLAGRSCHTPEPSATRGKLHLSQSLTCVTGFQAACQDACAFTSQVVMTCQGHHSGEFFHVTAMKVSTRRLQLGEKSAF